jgi:hypothetical protein
MFLIIWEAAWFFGLGGIPEVAPKGLWGWRFRLESSEIPRKSMHHELK